MKLRLQNFKCFEDVELDLKPLTLFFGRNSSGKSTVIQGLSLLSSVFVDSSDSRSKSIQKYPKFQTETLNLGSFKRCVFEQDADQQISLKLDVQHQFNPHPLPFVVRGSKKGFLRAVDINYESKMRQKLPQSTELSVEMSFSSPGEITKITTYGKNIFPFAVSGPTPELSTQRYLMPLLDKFDTDYMTRRRALVECLGHKDVSEFFATWIIPRMTAVHERLKMLQKSSETITPTSKSSGKASYTLAASLSRKWNALQDEIVGLMYESGYSPDEDDTEDEIAYPDPDKQELFLSLMNLSIDRLKTTPLELGPVTQEFFFSELGLGDDDVDTSSDIAVFMRDYMAQMCVEDFIFSIEKCSDEIVAALKKHNRKGSTHLLKVDLETDMLFTITSESVDSFVTNLPIFSSFWRKLTKTTFIISALTYDIWPVQNGKVVGTRPLSTREAQFSNTVFEYEGILIFSGILKAMLDCMHNAVAQIKHIPAFRGLPQRSSGLYDHNKQRLDLHVPDIARNSRKLKKALRLLGWRQDIKPQKFDAAGEDRFAINLSTEYKNKKILARETLADVGFGLSQILGIISSMLNDSEESWYLIEEPEVHLHPSLQGDFIDLIARNSKALNREKSKKEKDSPFGHDHDWIIETHSEYMLRRIQKLIAKGIILNANVAVYFCDSVGGERVIRPIPLSDSGEMLVPWPNDFIETELDEAEG
ncbi:AAA family ATPase [Litorivicinus sp.]|nr:AAA family ATPase [Litorivicinus sp.]